MADQLASLRLFHSSTTLRQEIVSYLVANPSGLDGTPLLNFVTEQNRDDCINGMGELGTYGDHITLQRVAQIFQVQFLVVSTLGVDASSVVSPSGEYCEDLPTLVVGHIAEGHGDHYVSLDGPISQYISGIQEEESHRITSRRRIESSPTYEFEVNSGSDHLIIHSINV